MKVVVDKTRCVGSGMCTSIAPTFFDLDDDGSLVVKNDGEVDPSDAQAVTAVEDAVACCPMEALRLEPK